MVSIPPITGSRMAVRTLKENSYFVAGPRAFNSLPAELREFSGSLDTFKGRIDKLLLSVPDLPVSASRPTFATDNEGKETNAVSHWMRALANNSLDRRIHIERFGDGTREDLVTRLLDTQPGT